MSTRIIVGDCRVRLAELPAESVHCIVTSPPYYSLRDYQVAGQIGLEATPEAYVAELVAVFRECRRVLRSDATLWVNLGMSYASRDSYPSQSRRPSRALACDSGGTEPSGSLDAGSGYPGLGGGHPSGSPSHRDRSSGTGPQPRQSSQHPSNEAAHGAGHLVGDGPPMLGDGVPVSNSLSSSGYGLGGHDLATIASASLPSPLTSAPGSPVSAHRSAYTADIEETSLPSASRMSGRASLGSACGDPDCEGCGICWAYLAIPRLRFKAKDEINTPHLVAMALQADGWWLRQTIVWNKPGPMPESVTDRCTKAHEYLFLLSKSANYYYDSDAIKEACDPFNVEHGRKYGHMPSIDAKGNPDRNDNGGRGTHVGVAPGRETRNKRSVWTVATQPFSEAHFATFPPDLIAPCIKAGTSERGCCAKCGAPRVREVERSSFYDHTTTAAGKSKAGPYAHQTGNGAGTHDIRHGVLTQNRTTGWSPSCSCAAATVPATVLDPFFGAGTTGLVADRLGRDCIGIELNSDYADMAKRRITGDLPLFTEVKG